MFGRARNGRDKRRGVRPRIEALEGRELLAAPPTIISVQVQRVLSFPLMPRTLTNPQHTQIYLTFSQDMNPATVQNFTNYIVGEVGIHGLFGSHNNVQDLGAAVYNPATRTVTLVTQHPLTPGVPYQLQVNGNFAGLTDTHGLLLDGNNDGQPGGNFITIIADPGLTPPAGPAPIVRAGWGRRR